MSIMELGYKHITDALQVEIEEKDKEIERLKEEIRETLMLHYNLCWENYLLLVDLGAMEDFHRKWGDGQYQRHNSHCLQCDIFDKHHDDIEETRQS